MCNTKENGYFKCQRQQKVIVSGFEEEGGVWIDVYIRTWEVCDGKNDCPLGDGEGGTTPDAAAAAAAAAAVEARCDGKNDCPVTSAANGSAMGMHGVTEGSDPAAEGVMGGGGSPSSTTSSPTTTALPALPPYTADEDPFLCRSFVCEPSFWTVFKQCPSTGRCLPLEKWCDGVNDCIDYANFSGRSTSAANGAAYADDEDPEEQKEAAAAVAADPKKADNSTAEVANTVGGSGNSTSGDGASAGTSNTTSENGAAVTPSNTTLVSRPGSSRRSRNGSETRGDAGGAVAGNKSDQGGGKDGRKTERWEGRMVGRRQGGLPVERSKGGKRLG
ncbi:unnamed protein product [Closterium sp. Naga37s-1]|nr:unnamed protein product [Closterium sp. Naga37s-1]